MSQKALKPSKVPRAKKTIENRNSDHSYTRTTRQTQKEKQTHNTIDEDINDSCSEDSFSILEESAPCHGCNKMLSKNGNGICCNFCEHWYCLTCSKLKRMVYQALKDSPDSLMWFCLSCLTAFPGVKKMMVRVTPLEDKCEKLEERVGKLEREPTAIDNIQEIVRQEVREIKDIEARKLQMVCFNLPESQSEDQENRIIEDQTNLKTVIDEDMHLHEKGIEVDNLVRLGRRNAEAAEGSSVKPRPLRFKVRTFENKRHILQGNSVLKNHDDVNKSKIFITPDLTQKQREESFKLREELRYKKFVLKEKNLKISRGRIVSTDADRNINSTRPSEVEASSGRPGSIRPRTFVNKGMAVREGPPGVRPFRE